MTESVQIRVIRDKFDCAEVYVNGEKVEGCKLVKITFDFEAGFAPEVHLIYTPNEFSEVHLVHHPDKFSLESGAND